MKNRTALFLLLTLLLAGCAAPVSDASPKSETPPEFFDAGTGALLVSDPISCMMLGGGVNELWAATQTERVLHAVWADDGSTFLLWFDNGANASGLLCLDAEGDEVWRTTFDAPVVHQITAAPAGGVYDFCFGNARSPMRVTHYAPDGTATELETSPALAAIWHIYSAETTSGGQILLNCAYQIGGGDTRVHALVVLDNTLRVVGRLLLRGGESIGCMAVSPETGKILLGGMWFDEENAARDGFWIVLDSALNVLHRQDEHGKPVSGGAWLGDGRMIFSYYDGRDGVSADSLRVYGADFALAEATDDGNFYIVHGDFAGGYYTVSEQPAEGVDVPPYSSAFPTDMVIGRYDTARKQLWEKTFFARDSGGGQTGYSCLPMGRTLPVNLALADDNAEYRVLAEDYLSELYGGRRVTVTQLAYAEQYRLYELMLSAYSLRYAVEMDGVPYDGGGEEYLFFTVDPPGTYYTVTGMRELKGQTLEQAAMAVGWGLEDVEYSIWREGYPGYYGLGGNGLGLAENNMGTASDEVLYDREPFYGDGDYYGRFTLDGLWYEYYYNAKWEWTHSYHDRFIRHLSTTRTDVSTYRGGRVGMTREEIAALYPEATSEKVWSFLGDYLWYGNEYGWGPLLFFYFESNTVARIEMVYITD